MASPLRIDFSGYDRDAPFPVDDLPPAESVRGSQGTLLQMTRQIGEVNRRASHPSARRWPDSPSVRRRPEQCADDSELWVTTGASEGFTLQTDLRPDGLQVIVDDVIPLLEKKGLRRPVG